MSDTATATTAAVPAPEVTTAGATMKPFSIARRINQGGRERLTALGVVFSDTDRYQYFDVQVPADWELRDTTVSFWQKRLYDGAGKLIAQVFFRPTAGTPSIHVFLTDDEANAIEPA